MTLRVATALLALTCSFGCATAKRWGALAADDARALAKLRPTQQTLLVAGAVVASAALDGTIHDIAEKNTSGSGDDVTEVTEPFGGRYSDRVIAGFLLAGVAAKNDRAKAVAFDAFVSSIVASKIVTPLLKQAVGRARPNETDDPFEFSGGDSVPSNHSTQAFAVASVIAAHYESRWVDGAAYGLATLAGASRIYHDAHWFSDVVSGAVIGTATGRFIARTNDRGRAKWAIVPIYDRDRVGVAISVSSSTRPSSARNPRTDGTSRAGPAPPRDGTERRPRDDADGGSLPASDRSG